MLSSVGLSTESVKLLHVRGLSQGQVADFAELLESAAEKLDEDTSAKQVLADMSVDELQLLQTATSLADPIKVVSLSDEGAMNLLAQPDKTGMVDLNNDGLVEVGAAKMITFPPVNAPAEVHEAWEQATEGMSDGDRMIMQLKMHHHVYGMHIPGIPTKQPLPTEQQWSTTGWQALLTDARAALEFSVSMDGWTRWNMMERDFLDRFEEELGEMDAEAA